jgi:predicted RNase H-like HicB family nuclease
MLIEKGEDGYYIGSVLELKGCHSQGETIDELLSNIKEAIELYLVVKGEKVEDYTTEIIGIQKVSV